MFYTEVISLLNTCSLYLHIPYCDKILYNTSMAVILMARHRDLNRASSLLEGSQDWIIKSTKKL